MSSISAVPASFISSLSPADTTPTTGTTGIASNANQLSVNSLGSTFLKLLTQELQNQDPTAPVDSTAMVGQMISLNQLDQLAGINNTLTNQFPTAAAGTPTPGLSTGGTADVVGAAGAATAAASQSSISAAVQAALQALNTGAASNLQNSLVSLPTL